MVDFWRVEVESSISDRYDGGVAVGGIAHFARDDSVTSREEREVDDDTAEYLLDGLPYFSAVRVERADDEMEGRRRYVGCRGRVHGLIAVDHLDRAAFFAVGPHRTATIWTGGASHTKLGDLCAVLAGRGSGPSASSKYTLRRERENTAVYRRSDTTKAGVIHTHDE